MKYFYADNDNKPVGPLPREALDSLRAAGVVTDSTMIVEEGASEWREFNTLDTEQRPATLPPHPRPPLPSPRMLGDTAAEGEEVYMQLAEIAINAATKFLSALSGAATGVRGNRAGDLFLSFLVHADDFTETCSRQFATTIRRTSLVPEVRGTPTTALAREIRAECFASTDQILAAYIGALRACRIDVSTAAERLQESSVLAAALKGAAVGQMAGGLGKTGARLGIFSAIAAGVSEGNRQAGLLWQQRKAEADAAKLASSKIAEFLSNVNAVAEALLDFSCAKCFGGRVNFALQSKAIAAVRQAVPEDLAVTTARALEVTEPVIEEENDADVKGAPATNLSGTILKAVSAVLGGEARGALIYEFKAQIGLSDRPRVIALTNNRVWFGEVGGGGQVVKVMDLPLGQVRSVHHENKETFFSGTKSIIVVGWGGFLSKAILKSSKEQGEHFYAVLRRRIAAVNPACALDSLPPF
jgi:hypothetical protein